MLPQHLFSIFSFIILLLSPPIYTGRVAKPGCPDRCGNLLIPYPFGVGSSCSLDPSFNISCNSSTGGHPKAYITILDKEVIEINETYVRVKYPNYLASACYSLSDYKLYGTAVNLSGTPFTLSSENWLTAIGCDDMVVGTEQLNGSLVCASLCAERNDTGGIGYCPDNGLWSMLGNGCCRSPITGGSSFLGAKLSDLSGAMVRGRLFPCSYAFIQEMGTKNQSGFSYRLDFLQNHPNGDEFRTPMTAPIVQLDWRIGNMNCSQQLITDPTYACRDRNICVDSYNGISIQGYRCSCFQGYQGNAYLTGGCKPFSASVAKPGCLDHCGNISIPFPFGVGPNCYKDSSFDISCNASINPPRAFLSALNAEIVELNLSHIRVKYPKLAFACYNLSDDQGRIRKTESQSLIIDMSATQFTLSSLNVLTAAGCDDMVVAHGQSNRSLVGGSCAAFCTNLDEFGDIAFCPEYISDRDIDRYMPGFGCCQALITRGTAYLEANLSDLSGQWQRKKLFPCSYAAVSEKSSRPYWFPLEYLNNSSAPFLDEDSWFMPILMLDWRIGKENCKDAMRNANTFACQDKSICVDFDTKVGGYICSCSEGYEGNPYLPPGCQDDIDECADDRPNPCKPNSICNNTLGSFACLCPKGYSGDGRKNGSGCKLLGSELKLMKIILIGMGSGLGFLLLLITFFWLYKKSKKRNEKKVKEKFFKRNGGLLLEQQTNEGAVGKTKVFSVKELEAATDHFNDSRIIGQGGQGTVYKGMLSDGKNVAIKKSKVVEENHLEQFINEVVILSQINHRNVVRLLGCCLETEVPLLVYEFMPNGTLFELIHDPNNEFPFPWNTRLKVAADIAGALAYLHSASSLSIYHRDIKSSNILLDERYVVKVSDFGTSRSVAADQTHLTTLVKGTFGYLDPEYFQSSQFTEKSDVYSFGVVLVELLTGQRPISFDRTEEERGLATRFLTCMDDNCLDTILDPQVISDLQGRNEDVTLVARLAQRCLNLKGKMRPTMKEVANELESLRLSQMSTGDGYEDVRSFEDDTPMTISDIEYTWTGSYKSALASPSDSHPLMSAIK